MDNAIELLKLAATKDYKFNNDGQIFVTEKSNSKPEVYIWVQGMKFKLETGEEFNIEEANEVANRTATILKIPRSK